MSDSLPAYRLGPDDVLVVSSWLTGSAVQAVRQGNRVTVSPAALVRLMMGEPEPAVTLPTPEDLGVPAHLLEHRPGAGG